MSNAAGEETDKRTRKHTHTHIQAEPTRDVYSRGEKEGRKGSSGSLSRRGIQRIRDISRQNQLLIWFPGVGAEVGAEVRAKSHEGRTRGR